MTGLPRELGTSTFKLEDYPIDNSHRKLKVAMSKFENSLSSHVCFSRTSELTFVLLSILVGAGFSGIIAGIRIDQRLKNVELNIYEKNHQVGGTW